MFFLELSAISKKSHLILCYGKSVSDMTVFSKKNCEEGHTLEVSEKKKNPSSFSFLKKLSCHFQMFKLINLITKIFFWKYIMNRGGFRTAATSKMERFVIIVNKALHLRCCSSLRCVFDECCIKNVNENCLNLLLHCITKSISSFVYATEAWVPQGSTESLLSHMS